MEIDWKRTVGTSVFYYRKRRADPNVLLERGIPGTVFVRSKRARYTKCTSDERDSEGLRIA